MKKMFIAAFVLAVAVAACGGKKNTPATPTPGSDMGSAAGSGEMGSGDMGSAAGSDAPAPGGGSGM